MQRGLETLKNVKSSRTKNIFFNTFTPVSRDCLLICIDFVHWEVTLASIIRNREVFATRIRRSLCIVNYNRKRFGTAAFCSHCGGFRNMGSPFYRLSFNCVDV